MVKLFSVCPVKFLDCLENWVFPQEEMSKTNQNIKLDLKAGKNKLLMWLIITEINQFKNKTWCCIWSVTYYKSYCQTFLSCSTVFLHIIVLARFLASNDIFGRKRNFRKHNTFLQTFQNKIFAVISQLRFSISNNWLISSIECIWSHGNIYIASICIDAWAPCYASGREIRSSEAV